MGFQTDKGRLFPAVFVLKSGRDQGKELPIPMYEIQTNKKYGGTR